MKIKVGVIFGGPSVEHEVSVISALQAIQNINKEKYEVVPIYISKERVWYTGKNLFDIKNYSDLESLKKIANPVILCNLGQEFCLLQTSGMFKKVIEKIDVAFPIVHGQNVEDGSLVGFLETIGVPYVGSSVLGASLGQDKVLMKQVFASCDIPIVPYVWFYENDYLVCTEKYLKEIEEIGYPVVVKPAHLGSSVGISFAKDEEALKNSLEEAFLYDAKVIVEKAILDLTEVNCSVIGNEEIQSVSVIEEVMSSHNILTFDDKYVGEGKNSGSSKGMVNTSRIIPAKLDQELQSNVEKFSLEVFRALNLSGLCRIDFLIDKKQRKVYVNEPNIIPGSLAFYLWEPKGKKYCDVLDELIVLGIKSFKNKEKKTTCFETNILQNFGGLKGSKGKLKTK